MFLVFLLSLCLALCLAAPTKPGSLYPVDKALRISSPRLQWLSNQTRTVSLADNVAEALRSMRNPNLPREIHIAELYFVILTVSHGYPSPTDISYPWAIRIVFRIPPPTPPLLNAVVMYNTPVWTVWTQPFVTRWPSPYAGRFERSIDWRQIQSLMPLEEADRRRRVAGYNQAIQRIVITDAGMESDYLVLGYVFNLDGGIVIRVNMVTGGVELLSGDISTP